MNGAATSGFMRASIHESNESTLLESLDLAIVDVETTGSSAVYDRVIEVGVLRVQQGRLVDTYRR